MLKHKTTTVAKEPVGSLAIYTMSVVCLEAPPDHLDWQGKEWVRIGSNVDSALRDVQLAQANREAHDVQEAHGGKWCGRIRDCSHDPIPDRMLDEDIKEGLRRHILNGPDGPGRRFLAAGRSVSVMGRDIVGVAVPIVDSGPTSQTDVTVSPAISDIDEDDIPF